MRKSWIPWAYYDAFVKNTLWLVGGTKYGIDQWVGGIEDKHYHTSEREDRQSSLQLDYN